MVNGDQTEPPGIVDRLLWQDARSMLGRHAEPDLAGNCVWCGWRWPCSSRRLAERAETVARRPWREAWTLRHDLNSIRAVPSMRVGGGSCHDGGRVLGSASGNWRTRHVETGRGYFG